MAIVPPMYMNSVVSIGAENADNQNGWFGSGFFVRKIINENRDALPFLVTNKHVFEGRKTAKIRMKKRDTGDLCILNIILEEENRLLYYTHPNPEIDIAVLPLDAHTIMNMNLDFLGFDIDANAMSSSELRDAGIDEGNLIYMLGFPMGMVNMTSMQPICRMGCIARIDDSQIKEKNDILADIQNFPGNSGSPIISRPEIISIKGTPHSNESVLIGIVHSYIPYQEQLISTQTNEVVEIRSENSGLAYVHPVEFIREIIDQIHS